MLQDDNKNIHTVKIALLGLCLLLPVLPSYAADDLLDRTGSYTLSFRAGNMFGSATTDGIPNIGPVGFTPPGLIPGSDIEVDDSVIFTFIPSYFITNHIAVDVFIGTPTPMGITATGLEAFGVTDVGSLSVIVPSIYLTAYPAPADWKFQPSVSVGVGTMLKVRDDKISDQMQTALGTGTTLDIPRDKIMLTARLGMDYAVSERWSIGVHATMFWSNVTANITPTAVIPLGPGLEAPLGAIAVDLSVKAFVVQSGITYRF